MRAKVTKAFSGVADGEVYPKDFVVGDEISGDLARTAVAEGSADVIEDDSDEEKARLAATGKREPHPMPATPNNPPSPAAIGTAGLPPQPAAYSQPSPGTEAAVAATATEDGGASQVEGPDTPSGGKQAEAAAEAAEAEAESRSRPARKRRTKAK